MGTRAISSANWRNIKSSISIRPKGSTSTLSTSVPRPPRWFEVTFVELSFVNGGNQGEPKVAAVRTVVGSKGRSISLLRSGAGTIELAIMAIVLSASADCVVFMDEPGTNLHPRTQRSLLQYLGTMQAQRILITHSPVSPSTRFTTEASPGVYARTREPLFQL